MGSPRPANSQAESTTLHLRSFDKVLFDELHDCTPPLRVCLKGFRATLKRNLIEPGFSDGQHHAVANWFQGKDNKSGRFVRVISIALGWTRMPTKREQSAVFHPIDRDLEVSARVFFLGSRHFSIHFRSDDGCTDTRSRSEETLKIHAEPCPKLL